MGLGAGGLLSAGGYALYRGVGGEAFARGNPTPSPSASPSASATPTRSAPPHVEPPSVEHPRLIGDGSTALTGAQPRQPAVRRLEKGERPPQFVVISWDGAGELDNGLFARFRKVAEEANATMTFFLSGLYLLPESKKHLYDPPRNPVGASDIGYLTDAHIRLTLEQLRSAWLEGHEIGTHFNGHFCGGYGSVKRWSPAEWRSEIEQATRFVQEWKTNTGFDDMDPLPFDYTKELVGGRTPCLMGQFNLLSTAAALGWRYDASSPGGLQVWPRRKLGIWDFPLQSLPFPGHSFEVLSMDYNMLANQSGVTQGDPARRPEWRDQARGSYLAGFERAYTTNRAPLFIGNHFEQWNGGIYMDAVEEVIGEMSQKEDVRMVSFRQFCDWLEAQHPSVVRNLQRLNVGEQPVGGWKGVVTV
ncbi:hypothetical protein ACFWVC_36640 [Streptomyces sp. NPDC058691]|uniref:hypothetical protein n=1 Tax=Streptomyces sp. NPDC058691 TaxID=3346601 RepID=UPI00365B95B0